MRIRLHAIAKQLRHVWLSQAHRRTPQDHAHPALLILRLLAFVQILAFALPCIQLQKGKEHFFVLSRSKPSEASAQPLAHLAIAG